MTGTDGSRSDTISTKEMQMEKTRNRRDFLKLAGLGGVVLVSGFGCASQGMMASAEDFYFVQLSDTHWGFTGPEVNRCGGTLRKPSR
jgi:hypothetical protein